MNPHILTLISSTGLLTAALLASAVRVESADPSSTLKAAFKDDFLVGAALNQRQFGGRDAPAVALVQHQFNSIAPENVLKWEKIHPRPGPDGYHFADADRFMAFGESNGMHIVGHTLVWHAQTPHWVFAGTNEPPARADATGGRRGRGFGRFRYDGPRASREELLERMRDHIHTVAGRYKGRIHAWDVVNEAISDRGTNVLRNSLWMQIIGPDFIAKAFEYAHQADPDAILRYNDYGLENPAKRRKLITLIKSLQEQGVPVMAIGTQTHVSASSPSFEEMDRALTEMRSLGLPIHVTELDVNTAERGQRSSSADISNNTAVTGGGLIDSAEQRQAAQYADLFRAFLKHKDAVEVVTFWGVNDAASWRRNGKPLLFDGDNQPKPAFDAVMRVTTGEE